MKIALMGYARSGKDTVGEMLYLNSPGYVSRVAFGTALKTDFHKMFNDIPAEPKPREGYEKFGKAMRDIDPLIWVKKLEFHIGVLEQYDIAKDFIITDLRQPNEANWAKDNGFLIIKVTADSTLREDRSVGDAEFHEVNESEKLIELIPFDYEIKNNGTLEELREQVLQLLKEIGVNK